MKFYALKKKGTIDQFHCIAKTEDERFKKSERAYSNRRGVQSKGTEYTFDDYMEDFVKVVVTVEEQE